MTPTAWQNLALAAMFTFYAIIFGFEMANQKLCASVAIDYCAYWSGGKISNSRNMADVYNLDILTEFQKEIFPQASDPSFETFAIMYPPVFVVPFKLLSLINLPWSYLVWTLINLVGFFFYLRFFTKEVSGFPLSIRLAFMVLLSLPVFQNLLFGQASIWLAICAGEFLRGLLSGKPLKAGLWLGGWLLKPQLLVLIIPLLLIHLSIKILFGFLISSGFVLIASLGLIGVDGFVNLKNTLLDAATGGVHSKPAIMMNWRMLGYHIESFTSTTAGWTVVIIGSLLTVGITLYVFRKRIIGDPTKQALAVLGICAATCAVTWHAHLHMSIVFIPGMVYLVVKNKLSKKLFAAWVFLPFTILLVTFFLTTFITIDRSILQLVEGLRGFLINMAILGWAIYKYRGQNGPVDLRAVGVCHG